MPVTAGLDDMHNPLRMVLALTQPEDFVAIKIDIDRRARPPLAARPTRDSNETNAQLHHCHPRAITSLTGPASAWIGSARSHQCAHRRPERLHVCCAQLECPARFAWLHRTSLEEELVLQILRDRNLSSRIDELFWEHHVLASPVQWKGWGGMAWATVGRRPNSTALDCNGEAFKTCAVEDAPCSGTGGGPGVGALVRGGGCVRKRSARAFRPS